MKSKLFISLLIVIIVFFCAGCPAGSINENIPTIDPQPTQSFTHEELDVLLSASLTRPTLIAREVPDEPICTDYTSKGFIRVSYVGESDVKYKFQVLKDDDRWVAYNLFADGRVDDFSLQFGDGEYIARILQHDEGDEYIAVETATFNVTMEFENTAYLTSVQNINWGYDMPPIKDVPVIVSDALTQDQEDIIAACVNEAYLYITENIEYDNDKIFDLNYDYVPDIVQTYQDEAGICYDYASLLASMLRSMGIPSKLVKGYASYNPTVYHAWNEVYLNDRWTIIDVTRDATVYGTADPGGAEKNAEDYAKVNEY